MDVAFVITDDYNNICVLSGINDDENCWDEEEGIFVNKNIPNISLRITDSNKYIYNINCKKGLYVQIMTPDLTVEISEKCKLSDFIDIMLKEEGCKLTEEDDKLKVINFSLLDKYYYFSKSILPLMRGMLYKYSIMM